MIAVGELYRSEAGCHRVTRINCPAHGDVGRCRNNLEPASPTSVGVMRLRCPYCSKGVFVYLAPAPDPGGPVWEAVEPPPQTTEG